MRKVLALLLVLVFAFGCAAGCGDDEKENAKAISFADVTNTFQKMADGMEIDYKVTASVQPEFGAAMTKEQFEAAFGSVFKAKADGSYEVSAKYKGEIDAKNGNGKLNLLFNDKAVTDIIVNGSNVYLNGKSLFEGFTELMKLFGAVGSSYAQLLKWPYEGEYIDLSGVLETLQDQIGGLGQANSFFESVFGMSMEELQAILLKVAGALPMDQITEFLNKVQEACVESKVLTNNKGKIELKFDASNLKDFVMAISKVLKENLAGVVTATVNSLKTVDEFPDEVKQILASYDEQEFQQELNETFDEEDLKKNADDLVKDFGDSFLKLTIKAADQSVDMKFEISMDMQDASAAGNPFGKVGFVIELNSAVKKVKEITAPENVITEQELQELLNMFGGFGSSHELDDNDDDPDLGGLYA